MDSIISVQDIRTSLGSIAKRAEQGEAFTVVRNSKPAFRIVPLESGSTVRESVATYSAGDVAPLPAAPSLEEIRSRFEETGANKLITPEELDALIHEVHEERNKAGRE